MWVLWLTLLMLLRLAATTSRRRRRRGHGVGPGLEAGGFAGGEGPGPSAASGRPSLGGHGGVVLPIAGGRRGRRDRGEALRAGDGGGPPRARSRDPRGRPTLALTTANVKSVFWNVYLKFITGHHYEGLE